VLGGSGLKGRADVSASLTASGKSASGLVASLAGSGTATVTDIVVPGINPDALGPIVAAADGIGRDIDAAKTAGFAPAIAAQGSLGAPRADIAFTVASGVLRAPPITLEHPKATVTADLKFDANDGSAAASGTISYVPGDEALVGSEPMIDYTLSGPLGETVLNFDTTPLAQFLTQRALEKEQQRVDALQAALLEKQRLRREVRYYAALAAERQKATEELKRAEAEARAAAEEAARREAEAAAKRKADEEKRLKDEEAARLKAEAKAAEEAAKAARAAEQERRQAADKAAAAKAAAAKAEADRLAASKRQTASDPDAIERLPLAAPEASSSDGSVAAPVQGTSATPGNFDPVSIGNVLKALKPAE